MKFVCDRCQTKYAIADEKVRGRILKVRCKNCSNIVVVKESAPIPVVDGGGESERTIINSRPHAAGISAVAAAPAARPRPAPGLAPAPAAPPAPEDDVQWFLALDGAQKGPFTRKVLIDKIVALPRDADAHVWNENLDGWKPPKQVPVVARDLQARLRAAAPPAPPPPPRPRAVPPPPSHAAAKSVGGLPSPTGSLSLSGSGSSRMTGAVATTATAAMADGLTATDLTPAPIHEASRPHRAHNGVDGHSGAVAAPARSNGGDSDALIALNLGGAWRNPAAAAAGSAANLLSSVPVAAGAPARPRNLRLVAAFIGIVGVCVVVLFNFVLVKKPPAAPLVEKPKAAGGTDDGFAALADKVAKENAAGGPASTHTPTGQAPELAPSPPPAASTATVGRSDPGGKAGAGNRKSVHGKAGRNSSVVADTTPPPLAPLTPDQQAAAARFGDTSRRTVQVRTAGASGARNMPDPSEISRVVNNNKSGIKVCYQRALLRDSSLTHGKITVHVSIGLSGRVKSVSVDGPTAFRVVEPCIRDVLSRWVFPASSEEYGTEFSSVFQGNE